MLPHDEVRQRPAVLGIDDDPEPHSRALWVVLHPDHLGIQMQRRFPGEIELDPRRGPCCHELWRSQEQPTPRHVFDNPVDDDPERSALRRNPDRDSNCFPFVHVPKRKVTTYVQEIKFLPRSLRAPESYQDGPTASRDGEIHISGFMYVPSERHVLSPSSTLTGTPAISA